MSPFRLPEDGQEYWTMRRIAWFTLGGFIVCIIRIACAVA
jgi:hypothetical protein